MITRKRRKIINTLTGKGFQEIKDSDHHKLIFFIDGKKVGLSTKISRGTKYRDVPEGLLKMMKRQVKLNDLDQFLQLIDCPMSESDYKDFLSQSGYIK